MIDTVTEVVPVKGLVFEHARRTEYDGSPSVFTVTAVRQDKVFYRTERGYYGKPIRCSTAAFPKFVHRVVSVPEKVKSTAPAFTKAQARALHERAHDAGMAAGNAATPTPMQVVQRANPLDDSSPIIRAYAPVMDGVCGFAWVNFAGNTPFGRAMKALGLASKSYSGGLDVWVGEFGQSMERKARYASAYAEVLREAGVSAYPSSRMD